MTTRNFSLPRTLENGFLFSKDNASPAPIEIGEFLTLGRDLCNHLVLDDPFASLRHARIERKDNGFLMRDLRSRNGTFVNGARIHEAHLNEGDRIRIGQSDFFFSGQLNVEAPPVILTSKNPAWKTQLERLPNIAETPFPVLLTGPSGTGKDVMAHNLHQLSNRKAGPFVSVNCSALSESLVESELFGHIRGSFTGATCDRKGAFETARGGTLFLDEVGDLPLSLQPKLLRALENNQIRPVGSDRPVDTDVRIISATHHQLKRLVVEERFRADLFFRLNVVQIRMPSLSERREDFPDLFYAFCKQMRVSFAHPAFLKLKGHSWPGNIRELKNVVSRAKAFCGGDEVTEEDVARLLDNMPSHQPAPEGFKPSRSVIREIELEMIKSRLIANRGNQRKTALELGMAKSTLHDRIRDYGIVVEKLLDGY